MIGEMHYILMPYYDRVTRSMKFKNRPALIVAKADWEDYVILPVSKISVKSKIHPEYDIPVDPITYPLLGLSVPSYVRTHKQAIVHIAEISSCIGNMKKNYEDLYLLVLEKREKFSEEITDQAIK